MSRDGLLPPFFSAVHPRFQTPWKGTMVTGLVVGVVSSTVPVTILVEFVSIGTLMAFGFVCVAVMVLRRTQPDRPRPFRCPWVPLVPTMGVGLCLLLMLSLPANNWYRLVCWFGLGCIIYFFYGRKHGIGDKHTSERTWELGGEVQESESSGMCACMFRVCVV
jgi:APA family basic amino acid/polyamine antiporter